MAWSYPSRKTLGTYGRRGCLHARLIFSIIGFRATVPATNIASAFMGVSMEDDLADRRCIPALVCRHHGRSKPVNCRRRAVGRHYSFRHSVALRIRTLHEEAWGSVAAGAIALP